MAHTTRPNPIIALRGYTRSGSFPLDDTSFFETYAEALDYVHNSKIVYPGQVISVDDKLHKKVRVYQVSYDTEPDALHKYFLEEISLGTSALGYFKFRGKLNDIDELYALTNMKQNDLYFVKVGSEVDENGMEIHPIYAAYLYLDTWTKIDLGVSLANRETDGLMSKELWQRLASYDNEKPGLLYHPGLNNVHKDQNRKSMPEDAHFIELETAGEDTSKIKIQSADKLKSTIYNIMQAEPPHVEINFNYDFKECHLYQTFTDVEIEVFYYPNLGGIPEAFILDSPFLQNTLIFDFFAFEYDENAKRYKLKNNIIIPKIELKSIEEDQNYISASVEYAKNEDTLWDKGIATCHFTIKVFDSITYKFGYFDKDLNETIVEHDHDMDRTYLAKIDNEIDLTIQSKDYGIYFFEFSSPYKIKQIVFKSQQDENFLELMNEEFNSDDHRYYYSFYGYKYYPIKSRLDFIIKT